MYPFPTRVWDELVDEFDLAADYGGRGMYSTRCIALTGQLEDLLRFAAACQRTADDHDLIGEDLIDALAKDVRTDDMGQQQVFYFPGVELDTSNR